MAVNSKEKLLQALELCQSEMSSITAVISQICRNDGTNLTGGYSKGSVMTRITTLRHDLMNLKNAVSTEVLPRWLVGQKKEEENG